MPSATIDFPLPGSITPSRALRTSSSVTLAIRRLLGARELLGRNDRRERRDRVASADALSYKP